VKASGRNEVTVDYLVHFLDCWNRHDIDGILGTLTDDCLYITGDGVRLNGPEEIRAGLTRFLETYPDAHWYDDAHFVSGSRGASEWILTATGPEGARVELDSCDLFEFREGKISKVSAYRRERPE
jgi:hypothetical protein